MFSGRRIEAFSNVYNIRRGGKNPRIFTFRFLVFWFFGFLVFWFFGFLVFWFFGFLGFGFLGFMGFMGIWVFGFLGFGFLNFGVKKGFRSR